MRLIDADKLNLWTALRPYCSSDVCCEVTNIIDNAPTINPYEWISVEDRLPEGAGQYWVVLDNDEVHVVFYSNRTGFMRDVDGVVMKRIEMSIVYWMPYIVPTPPTEKEN